MSFQYGCENDMTLNQLTVVILEKMPTTQEAEVPRIAEKPDETVPLDKVYYRGVFVLLNFNK